MAAGESEGKAGAAAHLLLHLVLRVSWQVPLHLAVRRRLARAEILIPVISLRGKDRAEEDAADGAQGGPHTRGLGEAGEKPGRPRYLREARPSALLPLRHFSRRL